MHQIQNYYHFSGEHYLTIDGTKYAARLYLPHEHCDLYNRNHVQKVLIPLIGTIRHQDYPQIEQYPSSDVIQFLQEFFGVNLVPAKLGTSYEVEYQGQRPIVVDNGVELIFATSLITNFGQFRAVRSSVFAVNAV